MESSDKPLAVSLLFLLYALLLFFIIWHVGLLGSSELLFIFSLLVFLAMAVYLVLMYLSS